MTETGKFRLVSFVVSFLALGASSCASAATTETPVQVTSSPLPVNVPAELLANEAVDGSIQVITLKDVPAGVEPRAEFQGNEIPFYRTKEGKWQAVMGVPFNHKPGQVTIQLKLGEKTADVPFTIIDGQYKSEVLKVSNKHVNPKPKDVKRIRREVVEIGKVYKVLTPTKYWDGPFSLPIDSAMTSPYGTKRVFNGEMKSFHQGIDLKAAEGTPILAASGGKVAMAKDLFFTGNTVILDHGYGVFTIYAHMSKLKVKKGQEVKAKQLLGLSGMTGRASGPHLHWGAVIHRSKVNPVDLTKVMQ